MCVCVCVCVCVCRYICVPVYVCTWLQCNACMLGVQFAEKIPKFAWMFDLPLGLVHQIHGFWLIDHMNFAVSGDIATGFV